jgi:multidrug resistance efflux pump
MHNRIRFVAPVLLIAIIGGGWWWWSQRTAAADDGTLRGSGTIEAEQVLVTAEITGRVKALFADEGQEVALGAPLAQIDTALLEAQLAQAQATVGIADANLALLKAGARDEELAQAEAAVAQAQAARNGAAQAVENATTTLNDPQELQLQIAQAQAARDAAQAALRKVRAGSRPEDIAAAQAALEQARATLQSTRDRLSAAKTQSEAAMHQAAEALTQAQARYAQAKYNWEYAQSSGNDPLVPEVTNQTNGKTSENELSDGQQENYYALFVQAEAAMHAAEQQLEATRVGYDAARQSEATGVTASEAALRIAETTLEKARNGATREDIALAQTALASAQRTLDTLVAMRDNPHQLSAARDAAAAQLEAADAALKAAEARFEQVENGARPEQIQAAEAQIAQARAAVNQIQVQLAKASLTAPRAGLILSRTIHEGEQAVPGAPIMTIGSLDTVQLTLYIAESDIGRVRQGQQVDVTIDSFPGKVYKGTVSLIAQEAEFTPRNVQTQEERVTTVFAVRVDLENPDHELKPGMPADAVLR